ncbi:hypothetical protein NQ315_001074 [Exocentrus adspersus]|uniref:DNA polymerase delta subunit 3 n=1 Tax=Exocentrus adspersus TaxID=1586481 RepID=A0AAV8WEB3_9CUCU|nr:hypothetical protein NQ315_001074 [Exocentrus adspersus]
MDTASEELYYQKIQELVQDDDKIVTVPSLASILGVSLQDSRSLISKYVEDQRKLKADEFAVTYILSGTFKDNGKRGVLLVKEDNLEKKRNLLNNNHHEVVYSIQKNKDVDFNIIALVDMFNATNIKDTALRGSVVGKNCVKRVLKFKKLPAPPPPTVKGKSSVFAAKAETSASTEKTTTAPKTESKSKPAAGIADLFKAAASKPKGGKNPVPIKQNKPVKSGSLTGFLTNATPKLLKAVSSSESDREANDLKAASSSKDTSLKNNISNIIDVDSEEEFVEVKKVVEPLKKVEAVKKNRKQENKKNSSKRQRDKSKEVPSKKRKRIIERRDSDSDDLFEKEEDTSDIIERSDEETERAPSPVVRKPLPPKNKRRKAVTRTYEDEEGFVVTKTEYIYETASEDESENVEPKACNDKKEEKPAPKQKAPEKKKLAKNQATLMSFFKKK